METTASMMPSDVELWLQQALEPFQSGGGGGGGGSSEGLNSGVPTRTTSTLTPTTLRSIEQTFIELQCQTERHSNQAGFVPPPVASNLTGAPQVGFTGGSVHSSPEPSSPPLALSPAPAAAAPPKRRGMGGRRPANAQAYVSPEEEERRNLRRERNKMAAARCRKRRLDQTNELEDETKGLERKKQTLQDEIRQLQQDRDELEFILETHRACCRMRARQTESPPDVKPGFQAMMQLNGDNPPYPIRSNNIRVKEEIVETPETEAFASPQTNKRVMLSSANPQIIPPMPQQHITRPNRPNFLNVPLSLGNPSQTRGRGVHDTDLGEVAGVAITTPSNGIPFNFDSLMEGGTGLTPVQPCATQQQKCQPEIGSPDSVAASKLVSL